MGTKLKPGTFDCYAAAEPDEPMFVLLARDEDAPERVEDWARKRFERLADEHRGRGHEAANKARVTIALRKISEALVCAVNMRNWRETHPRVDYKAKCNRLRSDGPTPCLCCPGECISDLL